MPKIKTLRADILRRSEIDDMIERAPNEMVRAFIAMLWLFGKRVTEILLVQRRDIWIEGEYLFAYFTVQKKPGRKEPPVRKRYVKRIKLTHPYVHIILEYLERIPNPESKLFPIGRTKAWRLLKAINPNVYPHYFRESLATSMAERGASAFELMHWFDWDRPSTAFKYVKRGTKLTEKWSDRAF